MTQKADETSSKGKKPSILEGFLPKRKMNTSSTSEPTPLSVTEELLERKRQILKALVEMTKGGYQELIERVQKVPEFIEEDFREIEQVYGPKQTTLSQGTYQQTKTTPKKNPDPREILYQRNHNTTNQDQVIRNHPEVQLCLKTQLPNQNQIQTTKWLPTDQKNLRSTNPHRLMDPEPK